jgi:signal transduction histidine kinase/ActR/RegA family two-component response regulator
VPRSTNSPGEQSGPAARRVQVEELEARLALRDLMGLLTLPALWAGRDAPTVLQLMIEAVERLVQLDVSYVDVHLPGQTGITELRVAGLPTNAAALTEWAASMGAFQKMAISSAPIEHATPVGILRMVRLSMGYSVRGGSVWFGAADPAFPTTTQSAFLRAAATLAATGLQWARIDHERQRASRAKDEFLAMLGHELRNPLAPIFASLDLIKRKSAAPLSQPLAVIERQARHLSRLVDDLLDVSRITSGKVELDMQVVKLRVVLANAVEAVAPLIDRHHHQLTVTLPHDSVQVLGYLTVLMHIFGNLLTNAAKYTQPQGRIWLETSIQNDRVIVCVRDNGPGISAELMPRLFRIFEQGITTIERSGGGLGIGLALVKNFVQLHEGTVAAHSEGPGSGSEFTVTLPLWRSPALDDVLEFGDPPSRAAPIGMNGKRILLVDDNVDAAQTMAEILGDAGFQVETAFDPYEALALAASFRPAMAILDIGLPGMDGYQLAVQMRERSSTQSQPVRLFALSGYGQSDDKRRSMAAGFERHFVKPVDFDELVEMLSAGPPELRQDR